MKRPESTQDLAKLARTGDEQALEQLFDRTADRVHFYIQGRIGKRLRSRLDPLDLLQETFLRAHRVFGEFEADDDRDFVAWLCRIADNCVRDAIKHLGAARRDPSREGGPGATSVSRVRSQRTGPFTAAIRREGRERLAEALQQLDDSARRALLLRFFQDATLEEIAKAMSKSPTSVRRILARALRDTGRILRETATS